MPEQELGDCTIISDCNREVPSAAYGVKNEQTIEGRYIQGEGIQRHLPLLWLSDFGIFVEGWSPHQNPNNSSSAFTNLSTAVPNLDGDRFDFSSS